jgi:hypothetical protein
MMAFVEAMASGQAVLNGEVKFRTTSPSFQGSQEFPTTSLFALFEE